MTSVVSGGFWHPPRRCGIKTSRRTLLIQPFQKRVFDGFIHGLNHCNDIVAAPKGCMTWAKNKLKLTRTVTNDALLCLKILNSWGASFLLFFLERQTISEWNLNPGIYPYPHPKSSNIWPWCVAKTWYSFKVWDSCYGIDVQWFFCRIRTSHFNKLKVPSSTPWWGQTCRESLECFHPELLCVQVTTDLGQWSNGNAGSWISSWSCVA